MRLLMESRHFFSCVEVMDWFYSMGYVVYDVSRSNIDASQAPVVYSYSLETSQETGKRILHELPAKTVDHPSVKVHVDRRRPVPRCYTQQILPARCLVKI